MSIEYKQGFRTIATCDGCGAVDDTDWQEMSGEMPRGWVTMPVRSWGAVGYPVVVACSLSCAEALALKMARSLYEPKP